MREITFSEATLEAMTEEMQHDDRVFIMGEDIARQGGIFGQFKGLPQKFGCNRVMDTPISETAIVGAGIGAAMAGMRPVIDMHFVDFITVAMDEVVNQMAKIPFMFGGQCRLPLVLRAPDGIIRSAAAQHSQSLEAWFLHVPGLKVVIPSSPADAKGLLKAAIRDDNPVLYFEHKVLFAMRGPVPEGEHITPIGKANVVKEGRDVTIVSYSLMLQRVLEAEKTLSSRGIDAEVIDLRTISPIDKETIFKSIAKTKRLVIVHEAVKTGGVGAEIAALVSEEALDCLDAPIKRIGAPSVPIPFSPPLEKLVKIHPEDIAMSAAEICG